MAMMTVCAVCTEEAILPGVEGSVNFHNRVVSLVLQNKSSGEERVGGAKQRLLNLYTICVKG
jgi:hypothetical protein